MGILLYCEQEQAHVGLSEKTIYGNGCFSRSYIVANHFVEIDGKGCGHPDIADIVSTHDAEQILAIPGYRLATPSEQESYYAAKRGATTVKESKTTKGSNGG